MITDDQVLRLFERADPARFDDDATVLDAAGYLDALRTRSSNVTIIEPDPTPIPTEPTGGRRRAIILAAAAAAVVIVVGAVLLVTRGDDDSAPITNLPSPTTDVAQDTVNDAARVARGFVEAYGALDADQAISYLADDADIAALTEGGTLEALRLSLAWYEAVGYQQLRNACGEPSPSAAGTTVHCTFDFHSFGSEQLGLGPFSGSYFDLTVRDGEIVQASRYLDSELFSPQLWSPFADWMDANHRADADLMYTSATRNGLPQYTDESFRLWEQHIQEYVAAQAAPQG